MAGQIYPGGDAQVTPNLGLALWGMDEVTAENFILLDTAFGAIVPSSFPTRFVSVSANYNAVAGDFVLCNTTAGGFTVTMPLSAANALATICVKKISSDQNVLTMAASGADTIDLQSTQFTTQQNTAVKMTATGVTQWEIS